MKLSSLSLLITLFLMVPMAEAAIQVRFDADPTPTTTHNFGDVRVGTSASTVMNVRRTGGGGPTSGTLPGMGVSEFGPNGSLAFGPIANGAGNAVNRTYTYTPSSVGFDSQGATITTNDSGNIGLTFSGTGVSPVFASSSVSPGGLIDLGTSLQGAGDSFLLTISNLSTNGDLGNLTNLSLSSVSITGLDASDFSVAAFSPQVIATSGTYGLTITLLNTALAGLKSASLTINTDQGAAFGGTGQSFSYDLAADVQYLPPPPPTVPEPGTMAICGGLGLLGFVMSRRRKS